MPDEEQRAHPNLCLWATQRTGRFEARETVSAQGCKENGFVDSRTPGGGKLSVCVEGS